MEKLNLLVTYYAKSRDDAHKFVEELLSSGAAAAVRNEDGCIRYDYFYDAEHEDVVLLVEAWESADKQKVHMTQPHMATIKSIKEKYVNDTKLETL